jgi:hypothetical protein
MPTIPADQELTHHCAKHDQWYMHFLSMCPICRGEIFARLPTVPLGPLGIDEDRIPSKMGLYLDENNRTPVKVPPVQMQLF